MTTDNENENTEMAKAMGGKQRAAFAEANKDDLSPDLVERARLTVGEMDGAFPDNSFADADETHRAVADAATLKALRIGIAAGRGREWRYYADRINVCKECRARVVLLVDSEIAENTTGLSPTKLCGYCLTRETDKVLMALLRDLQDRLGRQGKLCESVPGLFADIEKEEKP